MYMYESKTFPAYRIQYTYMYERDRDTNKSSKEVHTYCTGGRSREAKVKRVGAQ